MQPDYQSLILRKSEIQEKKYQMHKKKWLNKFHIGACCVYEIWEYTERLQQGLDHANFSADKLQKIEASVIEFSIKKRSSKSQFKSVLYNNQLCSCISNPISTNNSNAMVSTLAKTKKINSENLGALYEIDAKRDEKNKANITRLLATF
ncbi:hypothetical protein C2G38_2208203 [Gigaspora rosea]|uniref:Uncharacterized protein n=1 Tax=Gigaspora rosea TaxID=44941 RepID=A0A397UR81_9GLOM|nr:hypothetical protein C2G38_2208203 [Gigaspora rosea]CAG8642674.1 8516_t:CDS:1 [Gigaspora rosea]